jgi:anti-sigma factor RsiW
MSDELEPTTHFDPIEEELVAYLDDELDTVACAAVERRLADDEAYRQKLLELQKTWDLLDRLPQAKVGEKFTQTTVELVALCAAEDVEKAKSRRDIRRWLVRAGSLAAAVVAGVLGFLVVQRVTSSANEQLVRDLPVIENADAYQHAESIEFLQQLDESGLFASEGEATDAM